MRSKCYLTLLFVFGALVGALRGNEQPVETREEDAASVATNSEEALARLEWRGILALPGEMLFSLRDKETEESFWIGLNEKMAGFEVVDYVKDANEVTVRHGEATRTFGMSGSSVAELEEEPSVVGGPSLILPDETREGGPVEELGPDAGGEPGAESDLWEQAVEESARLREIDERFRSIASQEAEVEERLRELDPGRPEYEVAAERQAGLKEERRLLTELALTEVRASPNLAEDVQERLAAELRADFAARLNPPRPASAESREGLSSDEEGPSEEESSAGEGLESDPATEENPN